MLGSCKARVWDVRQQLTRPLVIVAMLLGAGCAGGGLSSGCSGCGLTPLTQPIETASLIPNAGSIRLTRTGLDYLQTSLPTLAQQLVSGSSGGVMQYPLTLGSQTVYGIQLSFCPGGADPSSNPEQCELDIELGQATFKLNALTPDDLTISGQLPVRMQDLPITGTYTIPLLSLPFGLTMYAGLGNETAGTCGGSGGLPNEGYVNVPFTVTLPLVADTTAPRVGYTKVDTAHMSVSLGVTSSMFEVCANCDITYLGIDLNGFCDSLVSGVVDLAFTTVQGMLQTQIQTTVANAFCTSPGTTGACPVGSTLDSSTGYCDYASKPGTCLPTELGVDGLLDLGSMLQSVSPGTASTVDFSLAAGGAMIPANAPSAPSGSPPNGSGDTPNGLTLGLVGAMVPDPISRCVPQAANLLPTGIPIPVELEQNAETPWPSTDPTGPNFGLALSAAYMNYALGSVYNSGGLCLTVTSDSFPELSSAALSLFAPSIQDLTFEQGSAAMAIMTRPQTPPTLTVGDGTDINNDPLLMMTLDQFAIDFFVWSDDRYVRAFTFTVDLQIPISISTAVSTANPTGELLPILGTVTAANGTVTNSELLLEDPSSIAAGLTPLIGTLFSQVGGAIPGVSLSSMTSSLGVSLDIPDGGIRKLTSGTHDFVGLFGDLSAAPAAAVKARPQARIVQTVVHPEAMSLTTYEPSKLPELHVALGTAIAAALPVEYAYWIDQGTRSVWSTATDVVVKDQALFLQSKHTLYVTAREVGVPSSEAAQPVAVPFIIDVLPPILTLKTTPEGASVSAYDYVTDQAHLQARSRVTDRAGVAGVWTDWQPLSALASVRAAGGSIGVEVRDEAGNVASSETTLLGGASESIPTVSGGCGCSVPGRDVGTGGLGALGMLSMASALVGLSRRSSRKRAAATALGAGVVVGAMTQGCGGGSGATASDGGTPEAEAAVSDTGPVKHHDAGKDAADSSTPPPADAGVDAVDSSVTGCGSDCNQTCQPALVQGKIGAYTSIAKDSSGAVWVAGYDDSAVVQGQVYPYGDLVVGKYDSSGGAVDWKIVDGLPPAGGADAGCPTNDPTGWRGGQTTAGPDVGLWTSIQLDASNHPIVSYYDATNMALKFASSPDGTTWAVHTVTQAASSDIGRYGKMLVVGGVPVISFLVMEPGDDGKVRSKIEVATGKVATPASASDWTLEDAVTDDTGPCNPFLCASPSVCTKETKTCVPPSTGCGGDAGGCATGTVCVAGSDAGPSCDTPVTTNSYLPTYPEALGDYITMAATSATPDGVGIVAYDRIHSAMVQVAKWNGTWQETVLDSQTGAPAAGEPDGGITPAKTGNVGVGASLFITSIGDWHVSYVNATSLLRGVLEYVMVPGGNQQPAAPEVVDDGTGLGGVPFSDQVHSVGFDSFIEVDSSGVVTISYQDVTAGTLRVATGTPQASGGHTWSLVAASQPSKFAGAFSHAIAGDTSSFANYWEEVDQSGQNETGNVAFVAP